MKYRHIEIYRGQYSLQLMCEVLKVSSQGYYQWRSRSRARTQRAEAHRLLCDKVCLAYAESRGTYGRVRVRRELRAQGTFVSEKTVGKLMRSEGL